MAVKTFPYAVIYEGKFYPPNTKITVKEEVSEPAPKKAVSKNDKRTTRKA